MRDKVGKGSPEPGLVLVNRANLAAFVRAQKARQLFEDAPAADNTVRAFESDWRGFCAWIERTTGVTLGPRTPLPRARGIELLTAYLASLGVPDPDVDREVPLRVSTIRRAYTGILYKLRERDPDTWPVGDRPPEVRKLLRAMSRKLPTAETRKRPFIRDLVLRTIDHVPGLGPVLVRNRALLLFAFQTASRRAEVVGYDLGDLRWIGDRAEVTLRRSKTDQEGKGKPKVLEPAVRDVRCCPVAALRAWIAIRGDWPGPLFVPLDTSGRVWRRRMDPRIAARVVKESLRRAGMPADEITEYAGHSLRAGFATQAHKDGKSLEAIARQTGHSSLDQLAKYIRIFDPFEDNAAEGLL